MIDIESVVFDTVYNAVHTAYPNARIDSGFMETAASFPAVAVMEIDSVPYRRANTDDCAENYTRLTYEVNVYSNKQNAAKSEARAIASVVDTAMQSLKFYRTLIHQIPTQERTIYRLYLRYEVIVGKPQTINGKTVYQMYRR